LVNRCNSTVSSILTCENLRNKSHHINGTLENYASK
jgi:hypothetical protein